MTIRSSFQPHYGVTLNATAAAATPGSAALGQGNKSLRITNTGTGLSYFQTWNSKNSPTPVCGIATGCPILPNAALTIEKPQDDDTVGWFSTAGSTLTFIPGEGGT